ncbi:dehydrogenase [Streptomyces mashuensis]|uniref:Dehydrogenase n=1 Tax=Streptomyces mashuensis TaxID=33904 RepID=A0A919B635_9ACTN|nr:SagB family peptide dehydrogenase [Streptomyces mashuensis]GHF53474.1 dehydrogenase [Streptomyces mashuensis]
MSPFLLSLVPGTRVQRDDTQGLVTVRHRWGSTPAGPGGRPLADALTALAQGPVAPDDLTGPLAETGVALLLHCLDQLGHTLCHHATAAGTRPLATAVPLAPEATPRPGPLPPGAVTLDHAAHLRPLDGTLVAESPRSRFRVRLDDPRTAAVFAPLAGPTTRQQLFAAVPDLTEEEVTDLLTLLHVAGFLHPVDGDGPGAAALPVGWSFHELLAHDGSRAGLRDRLYGPVFPLRGTEAPAPPVAPARPGRTITLRRPDLDETRREDRTFTDVLESRTSARAYGENPLTVDELATWLYRAARVRTVLDARPEDDRPYAITSRPYPSAGSAYELELYLAVHRCAGLGRGLYHYDALTHALTALPGGPAEVDALVREGTAATGGPPPDVHVTVASRIKRLSWKYAAHAYALTLKNTGVLLQTLHLVATAMGLSGCILGGGDGETPARAFGLRPHTEIPVGAFVLGSAAGRPLR